MFVEERQQAIAELITRRGRMSVVDLAREYDVTTETIRRDLSTLERLNVLRRVHGGAVPANAFTVIEAGLRDRDLAQTQEKDAIAAATLSLLPEADATLIFDAGSTTVRLAESLPRNRRFTVFTNSVPVASRLAENEQVDLHLLPGRVRKTTAAAVGAETVAKLSQIRADVAFIGTNGITVRHGLSTPDSAEAATKRAMIQAAQRIVVLADSTKIGRELTVRFADLNDIDVLVTDAEIAPADKAAFESLGIEVVIA